MLDFIYFLIIGAAGGFVGYKLKLPVGAMIGAMLAVALAKSLDILAYQSNASLSFILQVCLGAMLGVTFLNFKKEYLKKIGVALAFIILGLVSMVAMIVSVLSFFTDLSLPITILASSPGAIYEMAMLAEILGGDAPAVVFLHLARVVIIMSLFPLLLKYMLRFLVERKKGNEKAS